MLDLEINEITKKQLEIIDFNIQLLLINKERNKTKYNYRYCLNFLLGNNLFEQIECDFKELRYRQFTHNNQFFPVEEIPIKTGSKSLIYKADNSFDLTKSLYEFDVQKDYIRIRILKSYNIDVTEYDTLFIDINNEFIKQIKKLNNAIKEHNDYLVKYVNDRVTILL